MQDPLGRGAGSGSRGCKPSGPCPSVPLDGRSWPSGRRRWRASGWCRSSAGRGPWRLPSFDLQLPCWRRDCGRRLRRHERRAGVVGRTWRSRYVSSRPREESGSSPGLALEMGAKGRPRRIDAPGPMTTPFYGPAPIRQRAPASAPAHLSAHQRLRRIGGLLHSPIRRRSPGEAERQLPAGARRWSRQSVG